MFTLLKMNPVDFIQLGVAGIAIIVLGLVIKLFLKSQDKFVSFMERQETNFKETIDNHLEEHSASNRQLSETIRQLLDWLKYHNGKK